MRFLHILVCVILALSASPASADVQLDLGTARLTLDQRGRVTALTLADGSPLARRRSAGVLARDGPRDSRPGVGGIGWRPVEGAIPGRGGRRVCRQDDSDRRRAVGGHTGGRRGGLRTSAAADGRAADHAAAVSPGRSATGRSGGDAERLLDAGLVRGRDGGGAQCGRRAGKFRRFARRSGRLFARVRAGRGPGQSRQSCRPLHGHQRRQARRLERARQAVPRAAGSDRLQGDPRLGPRRRQRAERSRSSCTTATAAIATTT